MGRVAYVDRRKLEVKALAEWLAERVPLHFDYGDKSVSYKWKPGLLAEELIDHLKGRGRT